MTASIEETIFMMPKLGESIQEATVVGWLKRIGDRVKRDEPLLEVATAKVNSEIPAPMNGILKEIYIEVDQVVEVGAKLCLIVEGESAGLLSEPLKDQVDFNKGSYSPAVLRLAQERGISLEEIATIVGSGEGSRVTKRDIEEYKKPTSKPLSAESCNLSSASSMRVQRVKMSPLRKIIAEHMVEAARRIPHATLVTEVDMTTVMERIITEKREGNKYTPTSFIARAIARGVKEFPYFNASIDGDEILLKADVNLGIAVSVADAVVVPILHRLEKMQLSEIAEALTKAALAAREESLTLEDVEGGTITLTNFGMGGAIIGIPIIRYPEVAIIGMGAIQKKIVVTGENQMAIRQMAHLSLTFDHRVADGIYASAFLARIKGFIEDLS